MKYGLLAALALYGWLVAKATFTWSVALGWFGAFCTALTVVTVSSLLFGCIGVAIVVLIATHVKPSERKP